MADNDTALPEGTDTVINGAASTGTGGDAATGTVTVEDTADVIEREIIASGDAGGGAESGGGTDRGLAGRLRSGREKISSQAGERARGLVTQGLERSAEALGNVARMVGDTAEGIEERLGPEYGDYARRAATAIESTATNLAAKDPDELIDDTREFIRKSPGVALAGAAIAGFAIARLLKSGFSGTNEGGKEGRGDRA